MVKILMHGCNGHMGQVITRLVEAEADLEIIAGVDVSDHISNAYPVYKSLEDTGRPAGRTVPCWRMWPLIFLRQPLWISCWITVKHS